MMNVSEYFEINMNELGMNRQKMPFSDSLILQRTLRKLHQVQVNKNETGNILDDQEDEAILGRMERHAVEMRKIMAKEKMDQSLDHLFVDFEGS